jgi:hypothetical protein
MNDLMMGQNSLKIFLQSVRFSNPTLASQLESDCVVVSLHALSAGEPPQHAKDAADRLRREAFDLPVIHARVLESALQDLGY